MNNESIRARAQFTFPGFSFLISSKSTGCERLKLIAAKFLNRRPTKLVRFYNVLSKNVCPKLISSTSKCINFRGNSFPNKQPPTCFLSRRFSSLGGFSLKIIEDHLGMMK